MPKKPFTNSGKDAWGVQHGAGKGDKPRHNHDRYAEGYDAITWPAKSGERKFRKVYR